MVIEHTKNIFVFQYVMHHHVRCVSPDGHVQGKARLVVDRLLYSTLLNASTLWLEVFNLEWLNELSCYIVADL